MSSYFDALNTELRELFEEGYKGVYSQQVVDAFLDLETRVTKEVSLVTGDREFPDDLRERIQSAIAVLAVFPLRMGFPVNMKAVQALLATKNSELFGKLHSLFHEVASRRVNTRFGMLSDDPAGILKRRDAHDAEMFHPDNLRDLVK